MSHMQCSQIADRVLTSLLSTEGTGSEHTSTGKVHALRPGDLYESRLAPFLPKR